MPDDQQRFLAAVDDAAGDYKNAGSQLQRSVAARNAPVRWCSSLSSGAAKGWVGKVKAVDKTLGYGTLRIEMGERAEVRTTSTFLFDRETLIGAEAPLFGQIARLKVGQKVRFYGNFVADDSTCIRETSVTESGQAESPDFLFRFTLVEPE